jgi:hypothetical protein
MIVFDLQCGPRGHVFEAWFASSGDYETQLGRGLVSCPLCGSTELRKAVMAPRVGTGSDAKTGESEAKALLAALAAVQKKLLQGSEHVGDRFADEARAIHLGEAEPRSIHGRATREDRLSLADEGIAILPLPLPLVEPGQEN